MSTLIEPEASSTMRNRASIKVDFPAPVLGGKINSNMDSHTMKKGLTLPSNDTYLLASVNLHRQTLEHEGKTRPVSHVDIIEFDRAICWPFWSRFVSGDLVRRFLSNDIVSAIL